MDNPAIQGTDTVVRNEFQYSAGRWLFNLFSLSYLLSDLYLPPLNPIVRNWDIFSMRYAGRHFHVRESLGIMQPTGEIHHIVCYYRVPSNSSPLG